MLEKSFGLMFFLKQPKNQKETLRSIYVKITVDGKATELSTKRKCELSRWNTGAGRESGNKESTKESTITYSAIRISKVAHLAGVDRKLVYRYFGNLENLVEAYVTENDYWMLFAQQLRKLTADMKDDDSHLMISDILQQLFKFFLEEQEMQDLILMELSGTNPLMRSIHNVRETIGQEILSRTDEHFKNSTVSFRAVSALLVGGIYYIVLHTRKNGYNFADVDMKSKEGMLAVCQTIAQIIEWSFKAARQQI